MGLKRGDLVTDGLLTGVVCAPTAYVDNERRTVIMLSCSKIKIDLAPSTLRKIDNHGMVHEMLDNGEEDW